MRRPDGMRLALGLTGSALPDTRDAPDGRGRSHCGRWNQTGRAVWELAGGFVCGDFEADGWARNHDHAGVNRRPLGTYAAGVRKASQRHGHKANYTTAESLAQ